MSSSNLLQSARTAWADLPTWARVAIGAAVSFALYMLGSATLTRGLPLGIILLGATFGGLYALVAVGIVLVYRANRIVNFAQAELGSVAGVVAVFVGVRQGWPYPVALAVGLTLGAALGAATDRLVLRRFREAPRLILTVATLGIAQVLNGVSLLLALIFARGISAGTFETPFDTRFVSGPVVFRGDHLVVLVAVPAVLVGLGLLLRKTDYGIAIRAAADSSERAVLLGVPVDRLWTLVWTLAGVLSTIAVMLRVPVTGFASFSSISGSGTSLLLRALAAAVIARMDRLGVAAGAAVGLGILEGVASWETGNTVYVDAILVLIILVALVLQQDGFSRVAENALAAGNWRAIREVRPVPAELADLPIVRRATVVGRALVIGFAVALPWVLSPSRIQLAALVLIYSIVAVSLVILTGWAGQISLGHWALVGLGGATTTVLYARHGWDLIAALGAGALIGALVSLIIGVPALRIRGPFLAVTTLAFGVTTFTLLLSRRYLPWLNGDRMPRPVLFGRFPLERDWQLYYLCLIVLVLVLASVGALRRSRTGRALIAIRDSEPVAQAYGIPTVRAKLTAFLISGGLAGLAGGLYAIHQGRINPDAFDPIVGLTIFSMVVIGGLGSVGGAVLGAVYVRGTQYFLPPGWSLLASGAGLLLLLVVFPGGLGEIMYRARDRFLRWVANREGLVVPSLLADRQQDPDVLAAQVLDRGESTIDAPMPATAAVGERDAVDGPITLSVTGVTTGYDGIQVLFGVDLDVGEGELVALLGTNGAGKSTVLKAVSGLLPAWEGTVELDGHEISGQSPIRIAEAGIAQMPGGKGVFPTLTVAENLRIATWLHRHGKGPRNDDASAAEAPQLSPLDEAAQRFPILGERRDAAAGTMSGGEQQMLSLAMAFLMRPKVLLIDELSLGLAPKIVDELVEQVKAINRLGTTIVVVEQSVHTALRLADRAVFMEKGEVRFRGPTADLLDRPDVLRSVFLSAAAEGVSAAPSRHSAGGSGSSVGFEVVLETTGLSKRYGGVVAVDDVSIEVFDGEILGLIGPNGAGKTSLFDLISGFVPSDAGSVILEGIDVTDRGPHQRALAGLGRSFQDARLWSSLTVAEAIAVAHERHVAVPNPLAAMVGLPAVTESECDVTIAVEELIELLGLTAFRDKFISELSTGSRRIVEMAAVLAHEPSVLLLDEPSSGIAERETEALGPLLHRVRDRLGCSLVLIEHDMPLLLGLADRVVALEQGAVIAEDTPARIVHHPAVLESYLGSAADA